MVDTHSSILIALWTQVNIISFRYFNEGFQDLSESDKEVLNELAEKFVEQNTAVFYDAVLKKGALGTTELYYTSV